jgi:hypothetical protein
MDEREVHGPTSSILQRDLARLAKVERYDERPFAAPALQLQPFRQPARQQAPACAPDLLRRGTARLRHAELANCRKFHCFAELGQHLAAHSTFLAAHTAGLGQLMKMIFTFMFGSYVCGTGLSSKSEGRARAEARQPKALAWVASGPRDRASATQ